MFDDEKAQRAVEIIRNFKSIKEVWYRVFDIFYAATKWLNYEIM